MQPEKQQRKDLQRVYFSFIHMNLQQSQQEVFSRHQIKGASLRFQQTTLSSQPSFCLVSMQTQRGRHFQDLPEESRSEAAEKQLQLLPCCREAEWNTKMGQTQVVPRYSELQLMLSRKEELQPQKVTWREEL